MCRSATRPALLSYCTVELTSYLSTIQALAITEIYDNHNYNMDPTFDSISPTVGDRCTGPNSFFNIKTLPSPTSPTQHISIPLCSPPIPVTHRAEPRRTTTSRFEDAARIAQVPANDPNIASAVKFSQSGYISPPSTGSQLSRAHPLPTTLDIGPSSLFFTVAPEGTFGILDSPLVMRQDEIRSSPEKPLSPPLTMPLSTLTLPETDSEFSPALPEGLEQATQDVDGEHQVGVRKDTLSDESEETLSDLLQSEGVDLSKLSPLSPKWKSEMSIIPENSALLGSSSLAARRSRGSLVADRDRGQPYNKRNRSGPYLNPVTTAPSPPWSPDVTLPIDIGDAEGSAHLEDMDPEFNSLVSTSPLTPQQSDASPSSQGAYSGSNSLPTPMSPTNLPLDESETSDLWSPGSSSLSPSGPSSHNFDFNHPFLLPLDIPQQSYHHTHSNNNVRRSSDLFIPNLFDEDYSMEVDHEKSSAPSSTQAPMSPLSPYDLDYSPDVPSPYLSSPSYAEPLPPPSSPSISRLSLPDLEFDLNDDESHPSSPSRRSFASLPDLEMDDPPHPIDVDIDFSAHPPPPSPNQSLLSLPGADTDEDLLPPPAANFRTPSPPPHSSSPSLLFIDDPRDVPLPRSPSPEDFDFDLNIVLDDESDPELAKLYSLHKKSLAAERAARHAEAQLIEAGSISLRAEATREKKKNKQKSKEIGTLLRLKMGDRIASPPSVPVDGRPKGMISSISQLVARMMFRRHDTFRPLANRKTASTNHDYVRSSLSGYPIADPSGADFR